MRLSCCRAASALRSLTLPAVRVDLPSDELRSRTRLWTGLGWRGPSGPVPDACQNGRGTRATHGESQWLWYPA